MNVLMTFQPMQILVFTGKTAGYIILMCQNSDVTTLLEACDCGLLSSLWPLLHRCFHCCYNLCYYYFVFIFIFLVFLLLFF